MKKIIKILINILIVCFLLAGCEFAAESVQNKAEQSNVQTIINKLTSENFGGRLSGTQGNEDAAEYIREYFENLGFQPFSNDSLFVPYLQRVVKQQDSILEIIAEDGRVITLKVGEDYIPSVSLYDYEYEGIISFLSDSKNSNAILLKEGERLPNDAKLILREESLRVINARVKESTISISLSSQGFEKVEKHLGDNLKFSQRVITEEKELNNVIAVKPGKDRSKAVVVGAHFDHVGQLENMLYSGALDNASGVATLLEISLNLQDSITQTDVVFCAWNGEEWGQLGSQALVKEIESSYEKFCYINIDCVGGKNLGNLHIASGGSESAFSKLMSTHLKEHGILVSDSTKEEDTMRSDDYSFLDCPSINIGQSWDVIIDTVHKTKDTADIIDIEDIEALAKGLSLSIVENALEYVDIEMYEKGTIEELVKVRNIMVPKGYYNLLDPDEMNKYLSAIEDQLQYDEHIIIPYNKNEISDISGYRDLYSLEEVKSYFPYIQIVEDIDDYKLDLIKIRFSGMSYKPTKEFEILKTDLNRGNILISMVELLYRKNDQAIKIQMTPSRRNGDSVGFFQITPMDGEKDYYFIQDGLNNYLGYVIQGEEWTTEVFRGKYSIDLEASEENDRVYMISALDNEDKETVLEFKELIDSIGDIVLFDVDNITS